MVIKLTGNKPESRKMKKETNRLQRGTDFIKNISKIL